MTIQLPERIRLLEANCLDHISASPTFKQAHKQWKKWNVIRIVSLVLSPLLITIPFVLIATGKMKEAKVHEHVARGLESYQKQDWEGAIRHWDKFNDSMTVERFRKVLAEYLPSHMEQNEQEVFKAVKREAQKGVEDQYNALFYPTTQACKSIKFKGSKKPPGEDNIFITFNALMGAACLHQASEMLEKQPKNALEIKKRTVLSDYYIGKVRGGSALLGELEPTYQKINQLLSQNKT